MNIMWISHKDLSTQLNEYSPNDDPYHLHAIIVDRVSILDRQYTYNPLFV